jgi:membrane-bound lytic murein transglycosylase D
MRYGGSLIGSRKSSNALKGNNLTRTTPAGQWYNCSSSEPWTAFGRWFRMQDARDPKEITLHSGVRLIFALVLLCLLPLAATATPLAGEDTNATADALIAQATNHYTEGLAAWQRGEPERARREWNAAIDTFLESPVPVLESDKLKQSYREMIETINAHERVTDVAGAPLQTQIYVPSPDEFADALAAASVVGGKPQLAFGSNAHVDAFLRHFSSGSGRLTMQRGLQRANSYRALAENIFKEEGVPVELVWLAQVESGWQSRALSPMGALGIWQIMPATGQRFGLRRNEMIDERLDFAKSTRAAARYLNFLLARYGNNWPLAIGAYNCGEGNMDRAIARGGGVRDFWTLRRRGLLPNETANYVPSVLAAILIASNPEQFDIGS